MNPRATMVGPSSRATVQLGPSTRVLCIGTEGATDRTPRA